MSLKLSDLEENQYKVIDKKSPGFKKYMMNVGEGVIKSGAETVLGMGTLGRKIQGGISRAGESVFGKYNPFQMGSPSIFDKGSARNLAAQERVKATEPGQGLGKFIGTTAQYLAPTGAITKGQQVLGGAARFAPKGFQTIAKVGARFIPEAIGTGAVTAVRTGGDMEQTKRDALLAGTFSVGLNALGGLARSSYWPALDDSVNKALGVQGKKSGGVALQQTAQKVGGLKILKDNADNLTVTLDDGAKVKFDPSNASYNTTLQAWNQMRKNLYNSYSQLATKTGEKAAVNLTPVREQLAKTLSEPRMSVYKNAAAKIIDDLDSNFDDLSKVDIMKAQTFLEDLNSQISSSFFKGTADAASSEINAGASRLLREQLDNVITETTGPGYQNLRSQYGALKAIEDDLVRKFQQDARSIGGGLSEYAGMFSSGDVINGVLSGQPGLVAKGAVVSTLAALKRRVSKPERYLRRAFDLMDDIPSDVQLRIWGGSKPLSQGDKKLVGKVVDSAKNASVGMSIRKSVTPESVAKRMGPEDYQKLASVIDDPATAKLDPGINRMLDDMGLGKASNSELVKFAKDTIDEYDGVANRQILDAT